MTSITLFVGDLSYFCNESNLIELFSCYGHVERAIIRRSREGMTLNYGFVTITKDSALNPTLIEDLEGRLFLGRHLRVNLQNQNATKPLVSPRKALISYQVYVRFQSDVLNVRVDETNLLSIFSAYGPIVDCIVKEHTFLPETHRTCGYAFLYYQEKEGAARAVTATNRADDIQTIANSGTILPTGMVVNNVLYKCSFPKVLAQSTNNNESSNITSDNKEVNKTSCTKTLEADDTGSSSIIPSVTITDEPSKSNDKIHPSPSLQPTTKYKLDKQINHDISSSVQSVTSNSSLNVSFATGAVHPSIVQPQIKKPQPFTVDLNKDKVSPHPSPGLIQCSLHSTPTFGVSQVMSSYPMGVTQTTMSSHTQQQLQPQQHSTSQPSMVMPLTEAYPTNVHPQNSNSYMHTAVPHHQPYLVPVAPPTSYHPNQPTITSTTELVPAGMVPFINQATHPNMQQPMYFYPTPVPGSSVYSSPTLTQPTDYTAIATNNHPTTALNQTHSHPQYPSTAHNASYLPLQQHAPIDHQDHHTHQINTSKQTNSYNPSYPMQSMIIPIFPTQQPMPMHPLTPAFIPSQIIQYPPQQPFINNNSNGMDTHNKQISMYVSPGYPPNSHIMYPLQSMQTTVSPPMYHTPFHSHNNSNHAGNAEKNITHNNASASTK